MCVHDAIYRPPCPMMPNFRVQRIATICCRYSDCCLKAMILGPFVMICRPIATPVMRYQLRVRLQKNPA
jgi:hypothetical protein